MMESNVDLIFCEIIFKISFLNFKRRIRGVKWLFNRFFPCRLITFKKLKNVDALDSSKAKDGLQSF